MLFDGTEVHHLSGDRVKLENAHGTGCTFASAIAAQLAAGRSLIEALTLAKAYVVKAMEKAYPIGKGRVPLDHFYRMKIEPLARGTHEVPAAWTASGGRAGSSLERRNTEVIRLSVPPGQLDGRRTNAKDISLRRV